MFVLPPPPPRYTIPIAYAAGAANGMAVPIIETNNVIKHPEGGCPLQVGEGTYELVDDLHLATPPPHPSEAPIVNPNPLATVPNPPTSGVKLSLIITSNNKSPPNLYNSRVSNFDLKSIKESEKEGRHSESGSWSYISAPAFGQDNPALMIASAKDGLKRRKPKNNIIKSSSSFVSRVITHESSTKRLADRNPDGIFAFANINRAFQWLDLSSPNKEEPVAKILFTKAHMLCHDVNEVSKSSSHIDVIMGSSAGDIIWYEPMSAKYARINKNGAVNNSAVTHIKWIPGSENLFMAAHANGQLVVYDKEKDDALFTPEVEEGIDGVASSSSSKVIQILKSVNSKNQRTNPVSVWKLSNRRINHFAFSPDKRHLAVVLEDGTLRVLDYLKEEVTDIFASYYGGMICVCWSPDGKYMVSGGQDDLITIWSLAERKIIARCQGHNSWVSAVAFDPWRCDERNYRFGSVGDDCRLLLWDFNVGMLHRPKALQANARHRNSITTGIPQLSRQRTDSLSNRKRSDSDRTEKPTDADELDNLRHPVQPRKMTALLPPIMSKEVGSDPISGLAFQEDFIFTSSLEGHIHTWTRPREGVTNESRANLSLTKSGSSVGPGSVL